MKILASTLFLLLVLALAVTCALAQSDATAPDPQLTVPMPVWWRATRTAVKQKGARRISIANGPATPRDCLLVVLDDGGQEDVDELHAEGWTPTLDQIGAHGIVFARARSNPVCSPARRSLCLGTWYFNESGIGCTAMPGAEPPLAAVTVADLALSAGVLPLLDGKWHLGGDPNGGAFEGAPSAQGFIGTPSTWTPGNMNSPAGGEGSCGGAGYSNWYRVVVGPSPSSGLVQTFEPLEIEQALTSWWLANAGTPRFAVWSMSMPHAPFITVPPSCRPPGYSPVTVTDRDRYKMMLASCDYQLGRFLAAAGIDLADPLSPLVIVVGDNGTPQQVAPDPTRAKTTTYERGIRVPFVMGGAGLASQVSNRLVHLADVLPTLADYWNVPAPASIDGVSVFGPPRPPVLCGQGGGWFGGDPTVPGDWCAVGAFQGGACYKLRRHGLPNTAPVEEFYDLNADPNELAPLAPAILTGGPALAAHYLHNRLLKAGVP